MEELFTVLAASAAISGLASFVVERVANYRRGPRATRKQHVTVSITDSSGEEIRLTIPSEDERGVEQAILRALAARRTDFPDETRQP